MKNRNEMILEDFYKYIVNQHFDIREPLNNFKYTEFVHWFIDNFDLKNINKKITYHSHQMQYYGDDIYEYDVESNDYDEYIKTHFLQLKNFCKTTESILLDDNKMNIIINNDTIQKLKNEFLNSTEQDKNELLCKIILHHFYDFPENGNYDVSTFSNNSGNLRSINKDYNAILTYLVLDHYDNHLFIQFDNNLNNRIDIEYQKDKEIDLSHPDLNVDKALQQNRTFNIVMIYFSLYKTLIPHLHVI